ncbi:MAG: hypothetical protein JXR35_04135 [Rhodobacteraceae bacterium]|nr:hypothetical protein [Paracoccaceae bacterium]
MKALMIAVSLACASLAGIAQADAKKQFYIPDKPAGLIYLFTCEAASKDEAAENWAQARVVFESKYRDAAAQLELETKAQRATGKLPSQEEMAAHDKRFKAHKHNLDADLARFGCKMDGLMHMP